MSDNAALGKLERVELRGVWANEATAFTPWLATTENLAILGEALGLDLECEAQERAVGPFRADILCKDLNTGHWVLVENQLERTDHSHLGQLLTYAAGLQAVTIVWVAARFTEEHRATLDWLNKITDDSFCFFGVEVELWRIGTSAPAPKFNIIAKPNNWSKSVAEAARAIEDSALSETRQLQQDYWAKLNVVLDATKGPVTGRKKPQPQSWMSYSIGRSTFHLGAVMHIPKKWIRTELYLSGPLAKAHFQMLLAKRAEIETAIKETILWEELPEGRDSRLSIFLQNTDPSDLQDWPRQHAWLTERLNSMHRVLAPIVRELDAGEDQSAST